MKTKMEKIVFIFREDLIMEGKNPAIHNGDDRFSFGWKGKVQEVLGDPKHAMKTDVLRLLVLMLPIVRCLRLVLDCSCLNGHCSRITKNALSPSQGVFRSTRSTSLFSTSTTTDSSSTDSSLMVPQTTIAVSTAAKLQLLNLKDLKELVKSLGGQPGKRET